MLFERHAPDVRVIEQQKEGTLFEAGDILLQLKGNTQSILSLERIALNALHRVSGIAKITQSLQQTITRTSCQLLDTRKTTPNFRIAEKWAVAIGGGTNHRMGLYDAIMAVIADEIRTKNEDQNERSSSSLSESSGSTEHLGMYIYIIN